MVDINFSQIEKKWQDKWEKAKCFSVKEEKASTDKSVGRKKKYYVVEMYPYPSGSGLHIGHAFNYIIGDICARFKIMQGYNVLHPMGFDSFGLPAENAAIKNKSHPKKYTEEAIAMFIKQQKALGLTYDWDRMVETHKPDYYKWDQWIFLKMFEKGLAFRKKAAVNWCPKCCGVLANEQVHDGKCWVHKDSSVEIKHLEQWFLKITDYADELYEGVDKLTNWPFRIKAMQKNWIGKSFGSEIDFEITNPDNKLNCVILHGCPSDAEKAMDPKSRTYDKHWIPWIKKMLEERGIKTQVPLMPEPWKADYFKWKKEFDKLDINKDSILIGHSCGSSFLVKWLGETKKKINKLILVAPWKIAESGNAEKDFYNYEIDNEIKNRVNDIIIFSSDNEKLDGKKSAKIFGDALNAKIIELKNKGHFTLKDMGAEEFEELLNEIGGKWPIFTTRADTIYGVTFMVISAQHPRLMELVTAGQKKEVEKFLKKIKSTSEKVWASSDSAESEDQEELDKEGAFTGSYAINPINNEKIPVYVGNFVVADYGSGMVMAVPAHDERDFQFAKKYKIPIKQVIVPNIEDYNDSIRILKTLDEINKKANKENIKMWVLGSLAYAFHSNQIYRKINDLDLVVKTESIQEKLIKILEKMGFRKTGDRKITDNVEIRIINLENSQGIKIEISHLIKGSNLKDEDLENDEKELFGIKALVVSKRFLSLYLNNRKQKENDKLDLEYLKGKAYVGDGKLVNSGEFNGWNNREAMDSITEYLEKKKLGRKTINYKLRDWLISRQRFWGTPIPIVYCDKCGIVPVPEKDLPVLLPENINFSSQKNPLVDNKKFIDVKCPKCGGKARREIDTMDTFVNSSWYFFRYCDAHNDKKIFDTKKAEYWMPMDQYIGGAEHATMHLIYSRFYTKFLRDIGLTKLSEPTFNLFNQGMVHAEDGFVMSKSRGNVVDPLDMIKKYSADTLRIFLVSIASPDNDYSWSNTGIESMHKFIKRFVDFYSCVKIGKSSARVESKINKAIKEITSDIETFKYNMAIIKIRALLDVLIPEEKIGKKELESYLKMFSVFCPHIAEELWSKLGNKSFISLEKWPVCDEKKIDLKLEKQEELNENLVRDIGNILRIVENKGKKPEKVYVYCIPNELESYNADYIMKRVNLDVKVFSVNDKGKYDPSGISKKSKPGKPGIFVE